MRSFLKRIFRGKKKALGLAMFLFLCAAVPLTGFFVMNSGSFDERGMAYSLGPPKGSTTTWSGGGGAVATGKTGGSATPSATSSTPNSSLQKKATDAYNSIIKSNKKSNSSASKNSYTGRQDDKGPGGRPNPYTSNTNTQSKDIAPSNPSTGYKGPGAEGSGFNPGTSTSPDWYATNSGDPKPTGFHPGTSDSSSSTTSTKPLGSPTSSSPYWQRVSTKAPTTSPRLPGQPSTPPDPENSECGSHNDILFSAEIVSWPTGTFCNIGTSDPLSPVFPSPGNFVTWDCIKGNSSVSCVAGRDFEASCESNADCGRSEICFQEAKSCIKGDVNNDGKITLADFIEFRNDFNTFKENGWSDSLQRSDLNNDKRISMADFTIFVSSYRLVNNLNLN